MTVIRFERHLTSVLPAASSSATASACMAEPWGIRQSDRRRGVVMVESGGSYLRKIKEATSSLRGVIA